MKTLSSRTPWLISLSIDKDEHSSRALSTGCSVLSCLTQKGVYFIRSEDPGDDD